MKIFFMIGIMLFGSRVFAQEPPRTGDPQIGAEGRLLVLKVVPGQSTIKLFFAGKKAAEIDFRKEHKLLLVTALRDGKTEILEFKGRNETYEVTNPPQWNGAYSLGIKSEVRGQVEELEVKIGPKKP